MSETAKQNEHKLTTKEVAARLRVDEKQVQAFIRRGELLATNVANGQRKIWRIDRADLAAFEMRRASLASKPSRPRRTIEYRDVIQFV